MLLNDSKCQLKLIGAAINATEFKEIINYFQESLGCIVDAQDLFLPNHLAQLFTLFQSNPYKFSPTDDRRRVLKFADRHPNN